VQSSVFYQIVATMYLNCLNSLFTATFTAKALAVLI